MKRISAILALFAMLISSTACSNTDEPPIITRETNAPISEETTAITDTTAAPVTSAETAEESDEPAYKSDFSALELLDYFVNDDEFADSYKYCIDTANWEQLDNFDLFRDNFFGDWDSSSILYGEYNSKGSMVISDDRISHSFFRPYHFTGFYRISEKVYGFTISGNAGFNLFWVDKYRSDTIYRELFYSNNNTTRCYLAQTDTENYKTPSAAKAGNRYYGSDDDFISVYMLREMSKKYGIDYKMLVDMSLSNPDKSITLSHDDWYAFYDVYLISESEDRIVLETVVGDPMSSKEMLIPVICTLEKKDGKWVRNVEVKDLELSYHGE